VSKMAAKQESRRAKRQFTDEFKAGAVRLVLDEGKKIAQVSRDLGLTASVLRTWVVRARADRSGDKAGLTSDERAEYAAMRKELRVVRMERDILKKAVAFFAKENA
jgi:transposase